MQLNSVTYGISSSLFLAIRDLKIIISRTLNDSQLLLSINQNFWDHSVFHILLNIIYLNLLLSLVYGLAQQIWMMFVEIICYFEIVWVSLTKMEIDKLANFFTISSQNARTEESLLLGELWFCIGIPVMIIFITNSYLLFVKYQTTN